MLDNLLLYRVLIANLLAAAVVIWAATQGTIQKIILTDIAMCSVIILLFAVAMVGFVQRVKKTSTALNQVKSGIVVDTSKFTIKSSFIGSVSVWLVTLGLLGNIWGFWHAVDGLNLTGSNADALSGIERMLAGMKMAFGVSYVGIALGLWMAVNNQMLRTANGLLIVDARTLREKRLAESLSNKRGVA